MEKTFVKVAFHWLSTVVYGWEKNRRSRNSLVVNRSFRMGKDFRRSRNSLVVNRSFRMGKDFRSGRIRFFSPSPPHDFPCPFRIAIGLDTSLEALPTDSSLDSTSPARRPGGGCRLPIVSASPRTACLRLWLPAVRTTEGPASTLGSSEIGSDKVILLHNNLRCSTHRRCLCYMVFTSVHSLPLCDISSKSSTHETNLITPNSWRPPL